MHVITATNAYVRQLQGLAGQQQQQQQRTTTAAFCCSSATWQGNNCSNSRVCAWVLQLIASCGTHCSCLQLDARFSCILQVLSASAFSLLRSA
jgi:hypothetical protein